MNIYIEHTDGKFYTWPSWKIKDLKDDGNSFVYDDETRTDKRDFEIGSRVYFQGIGWTEVVGQEGCEDCCFKFERCSLSRFKCPDELRNDKRGVIFKKLEQTEIKEEQTETKEEQTEDLYFVIQGMTICAHDIPEEKARKEAERLSKENAGKTYQVLKLVGECKGSVKIEWTKPDYKG